LIDVLDILELLCLSQNKQRLCTTYAKALSLEKTPKIMKVAYSISIIEVHKLVKYEIIRTIFNVHRKHVLPS